MRKLLITPLLLLVLAVSTFAQSPFNKEEFVARRAKLFEQIPDGIAVLFAAKGQHYPLKFRQAPDFYYLTGVEEAGAVLVMVGPSKSAILFAPRRSEATIRADGPGIWQLDKREEFYGLTRVQPIEEFLPMLTFLGQRAKKLYMLTGSQGNVQNARMELDYYETVEASQSIFGGLSESKRTIGMIQQMLPHLAFQPLNPLLDDMRWIKSPYEITLMRKSAEIAAEAMNEAIKGTRPGMYEYEIEAAARFVQTKRGARGDAFSPIVASGLNTMTLHYSKNSSKMNEGDVVYMDYGADYDYYTSDITRTWPISGRFTPEQEKMYRCVLEARDAIIAAMKPGVTLNQLRDVAEGVYTKHGYGKEFQALGRYIGHTVGISVHDVDPSDRNRPLVAGVVFNVEPLLEFPDKKIHMRLEDTVLVTADGAVNMTAASPAGIEDIYKLIKQKALTVVP
ncbi:MAG TPA: Xaa-Pro peptidase family protein [Pyrinomonadaceae bacterium]|nr:Xaa-Pro peptidase family protein [Pyrinomonadaceae bacterium]